MLKPSLAPRLLPSFLLHTMQKTGREPGQFDHLHTQQKPNCCFSWQLGYLHDYPSHANSEHALLIKYLMGWNVN